MKQDEYTHMENSNIENKSSWVNNSTRLTSVNFDAQLHDKAKTNKIHLRDAIEFGIKFKIADKDGLDYPQNKITEKLMRLTETLNAKCMECEALRQQIKQEKMDEIFGEGKDDGN